MHKRKKELGEYGTTMAPKLVSHKRKFAPKLVSHKRKLAPKLVSHKCKFAPKLVSHKRKLTPKLVSHKTQAAFAVCAVCTANGGKGVGKVSGKRPTEKLPRERER